jgi:hypothetical protein
VPAWPTGKLCGHTPEGLPRARFSESRGAVRLRTRQWLPMRLLACPSGLEAMTGAGLVLFRPRVWSDRLRIAADSRVPHFPKPIPMCDVHRMTDGTFLRHVGLADGA